MPMSWETRKTVRGRTFDVDNYSGRIGLVIASSPGLPRLRVRLRVVIVAHADS